MASNASGRYDAIVIGGGHNGLVAAILAAQANRVVRLQAADDVLVNSGTVPELRQAVDRLHQHYLRLADAMPP